MALSARNPQLVNDPVLRILEAPADHGSCDLARDLNSDTVYNQEAFRYFLSHERKRSELSNRPFLLLLVDLQSTQVASRINPAIANKLFDGLAECLRDTDVIGWYHEGRVAGAVLTHVEDSAHVDVPEEIRGRVSGALGSALPSTIASGLQVRIYQLPAGSAQ
jgi:hypothetical protein